MRDVLGQCNAQLIVESVDRSLDAIAGLGRRCRLHLPSNAALVPSALPDSHFCAASDTQGALTQKRRYAQCVIGHACNRIRTILGADADMSELPQPAGRTFDIERHITLIQARQHLGSEFEVECGNILVQMRNPRRAGD